jgi:hypothetical protein
VRSGVGLLQGIALCGRCGCRLHTRYSNQPAYVCELANQQYGDPRCQNFMVPHIDEAVTEVFLEAIQPAHLEAALRALEEIESQRGSLGAHWEQRLERARYEADLARRRYERVDPDLRLVAAELEQRWEEKLQTCRRLEQEWSQVKERELAPLTEADKAMIRKLAEDIPALWHAETTTPKERKRLLRCLIQDVTLDAMAKPGFSLIHIRWHTGTTTTIEAERPKAGCWTPRTVVERIRQLAQHQPDDKIADLLNAEGVLTATGKTWNMRRVESVRKKYDIATSCPYFARAKGPRGDGLIAAPEAAERLGVSQSMIPLWFRQGFLVGHQRKPHATIWVRLTEDDIKRLDGSASLRSDMAEIGEAAELLGVTAEQVREQIRAQELVHYRLFVKNRWRWYVHLPIERPALTTER